MGMKLTTIKNKHRVSTYNICSHKPEPGSNTFLNYLRQYNLLNNKHIPHIYKYNSREKRLALLAGLLDTDGYLHRNCFEIIQKRKVLAEDICYLARSLGFTVSFKKVSKTCTNSSKGRVVGTYYLSSICGEGLETIPTRLPRKQVDIRQQIKNARVTGFDLLPITTDRTYYGFEIDGNRRFLLSDFTVTHNTAISIYIAAKLKLKTLIICNRIVLMNQWKDAIHAFCSNATVQIITPTCEMEDVDFYIVNATNVPKHNRDFYKEIGCLCVDESHQILSEKLSQCMRYIIPRYVIGLSATPYRVDGLNVLFDMYFGTHKIERNLFRKHTVYKVSTGFEPDIKLNRVGKVDWSSILESQCNNTERNELIIRMIKRFLDRVLLVLCKRVEQARYLVRRLEEEKEDVTSLIGSNQTYEQTSRILIGTVQKAGTGFDHPRLNAMILASDVEQYFAQYLGRVFRREDTEPIIFDLVDDYSLLNKHFRTRNKIYIEHGGVVKDFHQEYPQFEI